MYSPITHVDTDNHTMFGNSNIYKKKTHKITYENFALIITYI